MLTSERTLQTRKLKQRVALLDFLHTCLFVLGPVHHTVGSLLDAVQALELLNAAATLSGKNRHPEHDRSPLHRVNV